MNITEDIVMDHPIWILRGNRMPEKVEARGKRRKVQIPADATHWCHEGDQQWTPLWESKPEGCEIRREEEPVSEPEPET
jgi:hypothetical protein